MNLETERLISLIEFAQQAARMRSRPPTSVNEHGIFALFEHQLRGLPGVRLNIDGNDELDEVWLSVDRLHETAPPRAPALLEPWVSVTQSPSETPVLRRTITGAALIAAGTHIAEGELPQEGKPFAAFAATFSIDDFPDRDEIRRQFDRYLASEWKDWASSEIARRKTIRLYAQLFTLKQQLEGGIVEAHLELVWGVGIGVWAAEGATVNYPLVAQLVELGLDPITSAICIRPRDVEPKLQLDWYASVDNVGVAAVEKATAEFFGKASSSFSPFDRGSFEPILRAASANLDAHGRYWPDHVPADDRDVPRADSSLKVTDTWVVFARARSSSVFIQDLEKLKKVSEEAETLPPAVSAIVIDPATSNPEVTLPTFRGVSASYDPQASTAASAQRDLYFPKPFNDEQVRIVQLLESSDGVVVQGPPGTGKTHTIANVICHFLAEGKRVLVTSMKDAALGVLQDQLPEEIRPLAISLLASEQDGMKQFEHAIQRIASEVQSLDRAGTARQIKHLDDTIGALHSKVAQIDRQVGDWARRNLSKVSVNGDMLEPQEVAKEVVAGLGQFEWLPDSITVSDEHRPTFSDRDIVELREARRMLGVDIDYLEASLPQLVDFPVARDLLTLHQDLARFSELTDQVDRGEIPPLADQGAKSLAAAESLLSRVQALKALRSEIADSGFAWIAAMKARLRDSRHAAAAQLYDRLRAELERALEARKVFLTRPVVIPAEVESDADCKEAITNLSSGRSPFGLKGLFGKAAKRSQLETIRVLGERPRGADAWRHVAAYLTLRLKLRELAVRWNALSAELGISAEVQATADGGVAAAHSVAVVNKLKTLAGVEREVTAAAKSLLPGWRGASAISENPDELAFLEHVLQQHLLRNRLAGVWSKKDQLLKALDGRRGRVVDEIRRFVDKELGSRTVDDAAMQTRWSGLTTEVSRVSGLSAHLSAVARVTGLIETSGAPRYAQLLRQPLARPVDDLLPDTWRIGWRLRRLATYLDHIDAQHRLRQLAADRRDVQDDLAKAYKAVVARRTWLKLAENASPNIRAALQAYLNAIQKIGKGTGKRAVRFRSDARAAAALANPAVPCWIMAHYRVSESLPAKLGCFDLVVIDEASQSDLSALPALLRAQKVLVVGDDKQVSPEGVGLEEEKVRHLMTRFLGSQVPTYRMQMSPERSIYDLYKVVFAQSGVMLKEHFRCVGPIIEYSKREHYNHELRPLRIPRSSERLDPPLIDVFVQDGYRDGDVNAPEARYIVDEIRAIASDPLLRERSIGVVSLLADKQALLIWEMLASELGPDVIERHRIACGDARTFQGKERDIMFLTMVIAPNVRSGVSSRDTFAQRYNVAASRARDRMYLVRSVETADLSPADDLRRALITHFSAPYAQNTERVDDLRALCESPFEREVYDELAQRGYVVTPQVRVGQYRIDMVVEGANDARLAIECDGDRYHGADKWADDMQRQRVLERAGWTFWRCFASAFIRRRTEVVEDLLKTLADRGISPTGSEGAPPSVHTERRDVVSTDRRSVPPVDGRETLTTMSPEIVSPEIATSPRAATPSVVSPAARPSSTPESAVEQAQLSIAPQVPPEDDRPTYRAPQSSGLDGDAPVTDESVNSNADGRPAHFPSQEYSGGLLPDPRAVELEVVAGGLVEIVKAEGPVIARRAYDVYMASCGIKRLGHELRSTMNKALLRAVRSGKVEMEKESDAGGYIGAVVRAAGTAPVTLRQRGPRTFAEIPLQELRLAARLTSAKGGLEEGSEAHQRAVLEFYDLKRLTRQVSARLAEALGGNAVIIDD